ncbi:DUF438 domain-containing protein [Lachnoclostridium sp. Marseille-P6806]|uniref:DUF438 domain-containing protein n=1 Tax=Lachnoclostridium sp. Marseille-P6806 TaxID=2364793 RepID=UPI00102F9D96|nr:DUF438 domain-containing protein [Lachnoclostridium sp. Marseille-P6806]
MSDKIDFTKSVYERIPEKGDPREAGADRAEQLKSYLKRLGNGEALATVRADFIESFRDVEASEIMRAEQELLRAGTPLTEVQKLCDVHSALFHGSTREERLANAEKEVEASIKRRSGAGQNTEAGESTEAGKNAYAEKKAAASALTAIAGHPLNQFTKENEALERLLAALRGAAADRKITEQQITQLRDLAVHYAKKGDLLYPHLKVKYGISGPSDVMWTVDDEIRDELGSLAKAERRDDGWYERLEKVLTRAEEMIYKEKNILFSVCAVNFTQEEWYSLYQDSKDYAEVFGVPFGSWDEAERVREAAGQAQSGSDGGAEEALAGEEVVMPGGHMTVPQLTALLNTIPLEISFVDADNINRFFNEGPKVFKRPGMAIDREVFSCHPPKIEPMVRSILDSFRNGTRDSVPVWMEKNGRTMLVTYMAVRDKEGNYLGTAELVQDMEEIREHFVKTEQAGQKDKPADPQTLY